MKNKTTLLLIVTFFMMTCLVFTSKKFSENINLDVSGIDTNSIKEILKADGYKVVVVWFEWCKNQKQEMKNIQLIDDNEKYELILVANNPYDEENKNSITQFLSDNDIKCQAYIIDNDFNYTDDTQALMKNMFTKTHEFVRAIIPNEEEIDGPIFAIFDDYGKLVYFMSIDKLKNQQMQEQNLDALTKDQSLKIEKSFFRNQIEYIRTYFE